MLEQRKAIDKYATEHELPVTLTENQWKLLEKLVGLLRPFEVTAQQISRKDASLANVIPVVTALSVTLQRHDNDTDVEIMKTVLVNELKQHFSSLKHERPYVVAMAIDPRYRLRLLQGGEWQVATAMLTAEVRRLKDIADGSSDAASAYGPRADESVPASISCVDDVLDELLDSSAPLSLAAEDKNTDVDSQVQHYLSLPNISRHDSVTSWWKANAHHFPDVAAVARCFLATPATSILSKQLSGSAGHVYSGHRDGDLPECAEQLLFIKHNMALVDY